MQRKLHSSYNKKTDWRRFSMKKKEISLWFTDAFQKNKTHERWTIFTWINKNTLLPNLLLFILWLVQMRYLGSGVRFILFTYRVFKHALSYFKPTFFRLKWHSKQKALIFGILSRGDLCLIHDFFIIILYSASTASDLQGVKIQVIWSHAASNLRLWD